MKYQSGTDPFYTSTRWKKLREAVLRRDRYECQYSKRQKFIPDHAEIVHHILPREYFPEFQWQPWNLVSLSLANHNRMHDRETDQLTPEGMSMVRRMARKRGMDLKAIEKRLGR